MLLASLTTGVVERLWPASMIAGDRIKTLMPMFDHPGHSDVMLTPQIAGNTKRQLGEPVADLTACRDETIAAKD